MFVMHYERRDLKAIITNIDGIAGENNGDQIWNERDGKKYRRSMRSAEELLRVVEGGDVT